MRALGEVLKQEADAMRSSPIEVLLAAGLASFQTSGFLLLIVVLMYQGGSLGDVLAGSSLPAGTLVFVFLWLTNFLCTLRAVRQVGVEHLQQAPFGRMLAQGMKWGGVNGVVFFLPPLTGLIIFIAARAIVTGEADALANVLAFGVLLGLLGAFASFLVGMIVGFAFAAVEAVLLGCALAWSRASGVPVKGRT
jgi:hypothetical protein